MKTHSRYLLPLAAAFVTLPALAADNSPSSAAIGAGNAFNPAISVILDGYYYRDNADGEAAALAGEVDGITHTDHEEAEGDEHAHGGTEPGFNLRSAEIAISATVDHYFDAQAYIVVDNDGVELEEAWLQTRTLPAGLQVKAGKFFSGIGYLNSRHPHSWAFTDQNLAYLNLLGSHGLQDTGLQLTWLPETPFYTQLGVELLQGEQEIFGALADGEGLAAEKSGPRLTTAFARIAPNLGHSHALQLGGWLASADQHQEVHGSDAVDAEAPLHTLQGDARLAGLEAVYKYDGNHPYGAGDWNLAAEYLRLEKDLAIAYHATEDALVGAERHFAQDGYYLQTTYGIAPRWQVGLRYDTVGAGVNELKQGGTTLEEWDESRRWTLAVTWNLTEFSRLRLQLARADLSIEGETEQVSSGYLQWNVSLGKHGAHAF